MQTFLSNFKIFRHAFGLTQENLSKALSVDKVTIARYETETINPSTSILLKTISIYGISLDYFLLNEGCMYPRNLKLLKLAKQLDLDDYSNARSRIEGDIKSLITTSSNDMNLKQDTLNTELSPSFFKNLKEMRKSKQLTQTQLAEYIGVSRIAIAHYEANNYPSIVSLVRLSQTLDISIHALVTGEKLFFNFDDGIFGRRIIEADQKLSLDDHKFLIRLMESALNNKNLISA